MPVDGPDVIPSPVDPDVECVRIGSQDPTGVVAAPPPGGQGDAGGSGLCPDGYVPRRRRRPDARFEGKRVRTDRPAERNPDARGDQ
jgi:hypothetical protein